MIPFFLSNKGDHEVYKSIKGNAKPKPTIPKSSSAEWLSPVQQTNKAMKQPIGLYANNPLNTKTVEVSKRSFHKTVTEVICVDLMQLMVNNFHFYYTNLS